MCLTVILLIVGALGVGVMIGLMLAPPYQPHPDIEKIQRPVKPADQADIERRE